MLGKVRTGADFFKGRLEKDGTVGDRDLLHLLLETFKERGMIGAGLLERLELLGGQHLPHASRRWWQPSRGQNPEI